MRRIGIMGGTFDPIHYGHLIAAEEARQTFCLNKVIFVPAKVPPHKLGYRITDPEHRYRMVLLATLDNPLFEVSRIEIEREGVSYTVDTLRELRARFSGEAELFFITGVDIIAELKTWKDPEELLNLCNFIAVSRAGYSLEFLRKRLPREFLKKINIIEIPSPPISSTDIRRRVRHRKTIKYLVPPLVENYIRKTGLYLI